MTNEIKPMTHLEMLEAYIDLVEEKIVYVQDFAYPRLEHLQRNQVKLVDLLDEICDRLETIEKHIGIEYKRKDMD